jgi:SRSO17 transposase
MQHFITYSPWDPEGTYDGVIHTMMGVASGKNGALIIDDTGNPKKGLKSPAVARQYCGAVMKVDNCQVAVSCAYVLPMGPTNADNISWSIGMRLYMPKEWAGDIPRRQKAGIPDDTVFHTKTELALELLAKARAFNIPHKFTIADSFYGDNGDFRAQLRAWKEPYVMAVDVGELMVIPENTTVNLPKPEPGKHGRPRTRPWLDSDMKPETPREIAKKITQWKKVKWGVGTKGPLVGEFARLRVRVCVSGDYVPTDELGWLILERLSDDVKCCLCWGLDECGLQDLVQMVHMRWTVEDVYEELKRELGYDHFEGRSWLGWHHHAILTQLAYAFLAWLRLKNRKNPRYSYPTIPEVRRQIVYHLVETLGDEAKEGPPEKREEALRYLQEMILYAG